MAVRGGSGAQFSELPGTRLHPQGRLFPPTGMYSGDPWKLSPENWMQQPREGGKSAHGDVVAWHSSTESELPRQDISSRLETDDVDDVGRPLTEYGSAVGIHLGTVSASSSRSAYRHVHPARIPSKTLVDAPVGQFHRRNAASMEDYRARDDFDKETGTLRPSPQWRDEAANWSDKATNLVEGGKTIPYVNAVEDVGSVSYRTLPETVRTWREDVLNARSPRTGRPASPGMGGGDWDDEHAFRNEPHPALVHLAERNYNPVISPRTARDDVGDVQYQLPISGDQLGEGYDRPKFAVEYNRRYSSRAKQFQEGELWKMRRGGS